MNGLIRHSFTRTFLGAAIGALYLAASAFAEGETCPASFGAISPNGVRSYLEEYKLANHDPIKIGSLLQGALRPMHTRLLKRAAALSDAEIQELAKKTAALQPTHQGPNDSFFFDYVFPDTSSYEHLALSHGRTRADMNFSSPDHFAQAKEMLWLPKDPEGDARLGHATSALKSLATPIGDYGRDFAIDTQRTAAVLVKLVEQSTPELSTEIYEKNLKLLYEHMARAKAAGSEETARGMAPSAAMVEGVVSLHQLVGALLSQKIPGVETGDQALRLLLKDHGQRMGLTSRVASRLVMGTIGPVAQSGRHFKDALKFENGKLQTTKHLEDWLTKKRMDRKSICPFAGLFGPKESRPEDAGKLQTPIQEISELYFRVYEQVKKLPKDTPIAKGPT